MPRGASITVENAFVKGLITEYTAMNFPEQAVTECDNVVFGELGAVTRRLGMDYEAGASKIALSTITSRPLAYSEFKWYSTGPQGTVQMLVQQIGDILTFWTIDTGAALSAGKKTFTVNLFTYAAPGASADTISERTCQYTTGRSKLVVTHPLCDPFYISYDDETDTISVKKITIEIRDFTRLDDGLENDVRPTTITNLHKYNLYNQGWGAQTLTDTDGKTAIAFADWDRGRNDFPSNADVFWMYRNEDNEFRPNRADDTYIGNSPAPNGHYIYNAMDINRTAKSSFAGLPSVSAGVARPSCCAFYAGRVFYAGVAANDYSSTVYFTQIVDSDDKFGKCHQLQDPTAEELADLLDSDGGTISLPLIETVTAMKVVGDALYVLATNGIYIISGTSQTPFKATDYSVAYLSTIGATSALSIITVDGGLLWWNNDAIYALKLNESGSAEVINLSKPTIQKFINDIPNDNIAFIKGAYNRRDQIVRWIYSDRDDLTGYAYNRVLEFNIQSQAFYPFTIDTTLGPKVTGISTLGGQRGVEVLENVTTGAGVVTNNAAANVQVEVTNYIPNSELFKFTVTGPIGAAGVAAVTFGEISDPDNRDWTGFNSVGVEYNSYGVSGYRIRGDFLRKFQATPIEFVVENIDDGRLVIQGIWDYNFRNTFEYELYLTRPEVTHLMRRIKLRGKGRSLQIKFSAVGDHPFNLVGWSTFDTGGSLP